VIDIVSTTLLKPEDASRQWEALDSEVKEKQSKGPRGMRGGTRMGTRGRTRQGSTGSHRGSKANRGNNNGRGSKGKDTQGST